MPDNIPNAGTTKLRAFMRTVSFVSPENPTPEQLKAHDEEINKFLETIDNVKRVLNGRNCYAFNNRIYTLVWFLEKLPDQPVNTPFGGGAQEQPKQESKPNEQTNPPAQEPAK